MTKPDHQPSPETYLVADLFCGAGGSSTGAQKAITDIGGSMELVAVNHWNTAIATHSRNHPTAKHVIEDVNRVKPELAVEGGYLDILMASPECTYHSRARGGKPVHDQGRMNPWIIHDWLTKLDVRCVLIENVPEFVDWGPLDPETKLPDKNRKGDHFQVWFLNFFLLNYDVEWRVLNAADYGEATSRSRFFLQARKDTRPIVWPEPTHAKVPTPMFPGQKHWRGAREIIDWSNQGRSLFDDPKYRKKPLSPKTQRRIARGLERYGGSLAPLFIRLLDLPEGMDVPTEIPESADGAFIVNRHAENGSSRVHSIDDPVPTATARGSGYLVQTAAAPFIQANRNHNAPKGLDDPVPTITTAPGGGSFIVMPQAFLLGQQSGAAPRQTCCPVPTIAGAGAISLIQPYVIEYYGDIRDHNIDDPLTVITQPRKHALINPTLIQYQGQSFAQDIDDPVGGITAQARKHGLVNPCLVEYYSGSIGSSLDDPVPTITTKDRHGLVNPVIIQVNHGNGASGNRGDDLRVHSVDNPLGAITTKHGIGLVNPIVMRTSYTHSNGAASQPVEHPLPAMTTKADLTLVVPLLEELRDSGVDPRRIIFLDGHPYLLDLRFRMLQNSELARAMGFDDEESSYEFVGTVAEVTKQIGNAVPVKLAAALVKAMLG